MSEESPNDESGIRRKVLKQELGDNWRSWSWFVKQFSQLSLGVIGTMALAGVTFFWKQHEHQVDTDARLQTLEQIVQPALKIQRDLTDLRVEQQVDRGMRELDELRMQSIEELLANAGHVIDESHRRKGATRKQTR